MADKRNIVKFRNTMNFNIGFVVFLIIIIYVLFNVYTYFTEIPVSKYKVTQGTIASNYTFQGIIYRDETVEYANQSGYINYYVKNATKVSVHDVIYSIDTTGSISKEISGSNYSEQLLNTDLINQISTNIDSFFSTYGSGNFLESYSFYNNLNSEILHTIHTFALSDLSQDIQNAEGSSFFKANSPLDGIIVYHVDGYEGKMAETFTSGDLNTQEYKKTIFTSNTKVSEGDPVYKRINSEKWNIVVAIPEELAQELEGGSSVEIRFCKDDYTTNASYVILKEDGNYYLNLSLQRAMLRYINDRFIDIELLLHDDTGLKIPKSAITSKEFFTIPKEFFSTNEETGAIGLQLTTLSAQDSTNVSFVSPTIYYESETHYYIDNEKVSEGDIVDIPDSTDIYTIGTEKDSLVGVYNINKGYAVFKQIKIIYENEEYAIIATQTPYGVALYDHIALDADSIQENQLTVK